MTSKTFADLGLSDELLKAIGEAGYETPTPIQEKAIPKALQAKDVIGIAQTGTGKTASFTLPMIDILASGQAKARMPRSLILEPTRELAAQVAENFETYGKHHKLSMALLIGGVAFGEQEKLLDRGVDVLIATPGRLLDHVERGKVMLNNVQMLVVDEGDRMLDMGFIPDVEKICSLLPQTRQTMFFSATMAPEIKRLVDKFMFMPTTVEVARASSTAETVEQSLTIVAERRKRAALRELIRNEDVQNGIIFCNRKRDVSILARSLQRHEFSAGALHGDMDQRSRMETLDKFKNNEIQLLVASDVAARGLDIPAVSHVFNFDCPVNAEDYVHRIGRTGRAGRSGKAFMLASKDDNKAIKAVESLIGKEIKRLELSESEVEDSQTEDEKPRRRRNRRADKGSDTAEVQSTQPSVEDTADDGASKRNSRRNKKGRGRNRYDEDDDSETVVGMGDHVPAFMLRETILPRRSRKKSEEKTDAPESDNNSTIANELSVNDPEIEITDTSEETKASSNENNSVDVEADTDDLAVAVG